MPQDQLVSSHSDAPASAAETRSAYVDQAIVAYLLYGVGAVTAFLAVTLALSDAEAALHSSLMAVGLLAAGVSGDRIDALVGSRAAQALAYLLLLGAVGCIVAAPALVITLAGAGMVGMATGMLLAHLNRTLTRGGGVLARVRMSRSALLAMVASLSVPAAIGVGEAIGVGWRLAFVLALALIALGLAASRVRRAVVAGRSALAGHLARPYWLAWWLIVLGVSIEFSLVFWSSTLVERQVGISLGDATLVATSFYAGMATTRLALSFRVLSRLDPMAVMRVGLVVALAGSLLAWAANDMVPAGLGIYLGGAGTGSLYPLGVTVALALAPGRQDRASARLILASGVAILVAPLLLGVTADLTSVSVAWLLIPALCLSALGLSGAVARARAR